MENVELWSGDCIELMGHLSDGSVDLILADIPYGEVNKSGGGGLRRHSVGTADVLTFDLNTFVDECYRVCSGTIIIFCGKSQMSALFSRFNELQNANKGTVRQLVWEKTNPSPMNGQYVYLSGVENAVWFKKSGGVFNANCKNTVFRHPNGSSSVHPTEKNHQLLKELIQDNSNEGMTVLDPCMGSGSTGIVALSLNRKFVGIELDDNYFNIAKQRIENKKYGLPLNNIVEEDEQKITTETLWE